MVIDPEEAVRKPWEITLKERAIFTFIVMLGAFMAILDTTVVDVIVPKLTGPLSSDLYGVQWIITAYMVSAAIALLVTEYLIKRFGAKTVYVAGIVLFSTASLFPICCKQTNKTKTITTTTPTTPFFFLNHTHT